VINAFTDRCLNAPRQDALGWPDPDALLVDTYKGAPPSMVRFAMMNPFHFLSGSGIPVPGQPGVVASSIESIWQGLKIVDGVTDFAMFSEPPHKRPPDDERGDDFPYASSQFLLGGTAVDLVAARLLIYLPAYLYLLDRIVPNGVIEEVIGALSHGRTALFFDWDENFDIRDPRSSFSHSAILAAWFAGSLDRDFIPAFDEYKRTVPADLGSSITLPLNRYHETHRTKGN
jgi:hypothetical protein